MLDTWRELFTTVDGLRTVIDFIMISLNTPIKRPIKRLIQIEMDKVHVGVNC